MNARSAPAGALWNASRISTATNLGPKQHQTTLATEFSLPLFTPDSFKSQWFSPSVCPFSFTITPSLLRAIFFPMRSSASLGDETSEQKPFSILYGILDKNKEIVPPFIGGRMIAPSLKGSRQASELQHTIACLPPVERSRCFDLAQ